MLGWQLNNKGEIKMYIVMEIQTNAEGQVATLINQYEDEFAADSKFHQILASAAISDVPIHTAFILTDDGYAVRAESYKHTDESTTHEIPTM